MKMDLFHFESHAVRVADRDGKSWFVAKDICDALGLGDHKVAVRKLDDEEKGECSILSPGGEQRTLIVSESGLYALVLRCRDAMTPGSVPHRFRKWVTAEVLPSIRKTGSYGASDGGNAFAEAIRDIGAALKAQSDDVRDMKRRLDDADAARAVEWSARRP